MQLLRGRSVRCELFHENAKLDKQFKYAEKKNIQHIVIIGSQEMADGSCKVKNITTGEQQTILLEQLITFFILPDSATKTVTGTAREKAVAWEWRRHLAFQEGRCYFLPVWLQLPVGQATPGPFQWPIPEIPHPDITEDDLESPDTCQDIIQLIALQRPE